MERLNIFELLGSRQYHSCIISTYSFDTVFFESKVLKSLHSKGISNVNLLVDSGVMEDVLGRFNISASANRTYSVFSVRSQGCFHPKIHFFFGKEDGLVVIGSGNLTFSGLNYNDEIWGAFHYNVNDKRNLSVLQSVWEFLSPILKKHNGLNSEKIHWIEQYTPWFKDLTDEKLKISKPEALPKVYTSGFGNSIEKQLKDSGIPFDKVTELTIISPYYDRRANQIQSLVSLVSPLVRINVVLETPERGGIPPRRIAPDLIRRVSFYYWEECKFGSSRNKMHKLHAKIFLFKTQNKTYCLFGSANASVAAFGTDEVSPINEECSVLLEGNDLNLGLTLGEEHLFSQVSTLPKSIKTLPQKDLSNKAYDIISIDKCGDTIKIYGTGSLDVKNTQLSLFNSWGTLLETLKVIFQRDHYEVKCNIIDITYACFTDLNDNPISNKQVINDSYCFYRTIPNTKIQKLSELFSDFSLDSEDFFSEIIKHGVLNDDIVEDTTCDREKNGILSKRNIREQTDEGEDSIEYDYDELQTEHYQSIDGYIINSALNKTCEILKSLNREFRVETKAEEGDLGGEEDQDGSLSETSYHRNNNEHKEINNFENEKKAIIRTLNKYQKRLDQLREYAWGSERQHAENDFQITINELNRYIVMLYILIYYTDRFFEYKKDGEIKEDTVITSKVDRDNKNCLYNYCYNIIDQFLLICMRGFKEYSTEYTQKRLKTVKEEAFYLTLYCLRLTAYDLKGIDKVMVLNTVEYLMNGDRDILASYEFIKKQFLSIEKTTKRIPMTDLKHKKNMFYFEQVRQLFILYQGKEAHSVKTKIRDIEEHTIIYYNEGKQVIGFCLLNMKIVKAISINDRILTNYEIQLLRPSLVRTYTNIRELLALD